jgi:hypothetical protein
MSDFLTSIDGMISENDLETMKKEVSVAWSEVLFRHLSRID